MKAPSLSTAPSVLLFLSWYVPLVSTLTRLLISPRSVLCTPRRSSYPAVHGFALRGGWLDFDVRQRDTVGGRIDRKHRQPVTVLLKALGWTEEQIRERLGFSELMMSTLESDGIANPDEALQEIYRMQHP